MMVFGQHAYWLPTLSDVESKLFETMCEVYPDCFSFSEVWYHISDCIASRLNDADKQRAIIELEKRLMHRDP